MTRKPEHDQVTGLSMEKETMPNEIMLCRLPDGGYDWCDAKLHNIFKTDDKTVYIRLENNPDYIITKRGDAGDGDGDALEALDELASMAYRDARESDCIIKEYTDTIRQALQAQAERED